MDTQDVPATPDVPVTSLLSLPNELLVRIARSVAPDGGRQVGALRLTCRRVERVVSHIAWSSIHIQSDPKLHNPLLAILNSETDGRGAQITSVRYDLPPEELDSAGLHASVLSRLRYLHRLHVYGGVYTAPGDVLKDSPLPSGLSGSLSAFPRLKSLTFETVQCVSYPEGPVATTWLPKHLDSISLINCRHSLPFFTEGPPSFAPVHLDSLVGRMSLDHAVQTPDTTTAAIMSIGMALTSATYAEARLGLPVPLQVMTEFVQRWLLHLIHPVTLRKLRLLHVPRLFDPDSTPDGEALVLDAISTHPITELSLPVISLFHTGPELSALVMSNVTTLTLETDPSAPFVATPDLYTHTTHTTLTTFLSTSFPNLTTLHLTGWFDTTGIQGPATATPRLLSTQLPFVCLLLNALRWTGVIAITLKSSNGHADGDRECRFTRADSDAPEWTARLVQYI